MDSGAGVSICSVSLLEHDIKLDSTDVNVHGVTGNTLDVLGTADVDLKIGEFYSPVKVYVVENMADNVFIIGRDILEKFQCSINFKSLTLTIGNSAVPLMKAHNSPYIKAPLGLYCAKTVIIPPLCSYLINGYLKATKNRSGRFFQTVTGISEVFPKSGLMLNSGIANSVRGKTFIAVKNISNEPIGRAPRSPGG